MFTADTNITVYLNDVILAYTYRVQLIVRVPRDACRSRGIHDERKAALCDGSDGIVVRGAGYGFVHDCIHAATGIYLGRLQLAEAAV